MGSTKFNIVKKLIASIILVVLVVGSAIGLCSQYPNMKEQMNKWSGSYFDSWSFVDRLSDSGQYLSFTLDGGIMTEGVVPSEVEIGADFVENYPTDFDYYVKRLSSDQSISRQSELLSQLLEKPGDETLWNELESRYQYVVQLNFDSEGNVSVEHVYGGDRSELESLLLNVSVFDQHEVKDTTMVIGVPTVLSPNGSLYYALNGYQEGYAVAAVIPYMIVLGVVVVLVMFIVPFSVFESLAIVRGLLYVPLELRFLFVIATGFAVVFAPLLVFYTQSGMLGQTLDWYVGMVSEQTWESMINYVCWGGLSAVLALHALYLKEFFVIGPWQMIRRHTILGQLIWLVKRPKVEVKTVVEEKIVVEKDPRVQVIESQLESLKATILEVEPKLEGIDEVEKLSGKLDEMLLVCDSNQPFKALNFMKLLGDQLIQNENRFTDFDLRTRMPQEAIDIKVNEASMKYILKLWFEMMTDEALAGSRIYLEVMKDEKGVSLITRSVLKDEANEGVLSQLEGMVAQQLGTFESIIDGDLMKLIMVLK